MGFFRHPEARSRRKASIERIFFLIIERTFWYQEFGLPLKKYKKKLWVFTIFWQSGFCRDFLKIPVIRDFFSLGIFIPGIRDFFSIGIFIPGIRDFSKFRDFYPRDLRRILGFRNFLSGFLPSGYPGDFLFSGSGFFRGIFSNSWVKIKK